VGPTGQGEEKSTSSSPTNKSLTFPPYINTPPFLNFSNPQIFTKSHKLKYHFDWIFTLIMNLSLDFTVNVFIERKGNNNFEFKKTLTQKTTN